MNTSILFHELHQKVRLLNKELNERLKDFDLFSSQWTILYTLKNHGSMSQTEIWRYLNVEAPTVTRTLSRLEDTGWIMRDEGKDKREKIVRLTKKAEEQLSKIEKEISRFEEDMLKELSENDQKTLLLLLRKLGTGYK
ncbi:MarR family transcriptional regulator [Metabacillus arenae]|uniref:MarR family transcriptional regulator n=1 Tax=Metabacillus arenae TaxID=2771434 RepID=A0A926NFC4_9BACI|nr:MarR family transcriptional regulator [Metabacillus arenae]MBD1378968.1 MarR family transcriptional regulator [Metabacillus arenae]